MIISHFILILYNDIIFCKGDISMNFYPSVVENIANYAVTRPDTLALADSNLELTYAELNDCIRASTILSAKWQSRL